MSNDSDQVKWFIATFCREERSLASIRIQAQSQQEAEQIARDFDTCNIMSWDEVVYGDDWVESVEPDDGKEKYYFSAVIEKKLNDEAGEGAANE